MQTETYTEQKDRPSDVSIRGSCYLPSSPTVTSSYQKVELKCAGCDGLITDTVVLSVEKSTWHAACLKCAECSVRLDKFTTCLMKNGNVYCRGDYRRLFAARCARCNELIEPHELVIPVHERIYHANENCFLCCFCFRPLKSGEKIRFDSMNISCLFCSQSNTVSTSDISGQTSTHKPGRPRKRKQPVASSHLDGMAINFSAEDFRSDTERGPSYQTQKSKRMRTSFNHHQIRSMKAFFDINHNPDAKDLNKLAQKTGLTKRVLQVWFQNARAKFRRNRAQESVKSSESAKEDKNSLSQKKSELSLTDSNCSDSLSSNADASPDSASFAYEGTSFDDTNEVFSPHTELYPSFYDCKTHGLSSFTLQRHLDSVTQNVNSPTSSMTSLSESVQKVALGLPCRL